MSSFVKTVFVFLFIHNVCSNAYAQYGFNFDLKGLVEEYSKFEHIDSPLSTISYKTLSEIIEKKDTNVWRAKTSFMNEEILISKIWFNGSHIHVVSNSFIGVNGYNRPNSPKHHVSFTLVQIDGQFLFDGYYIKYSASGDTIEKGNFSNGHIVGVWQVFKNGKIEIEKTYTGKSFGNYKLKRYHENGNVKYEVRIQDNRLNDTLYAYYADGNLNVFGVFLKGMRIGEWKFYYPNEVLYCKGKYSDSIFFLWVNDDCEKGTSVFAGAAAKLFLQKKKDIWRYYDKNGKLIRKEIYSNKGNLKRIIFKSDMYIPNLGIYYESTKEIFWDIW